jgi:hypothetical protein
VPKKALLMFVVIAFFALLQPVMAQEAAAAGSQSGSANMWQLPPPRAELLRVSRSSPLPMASHEIPDLRIRFVDC